MENRNIVMIKHHPMNVLFTNTYYTNQFNNGENLSEYTIIDVTSRNKDKNIINDLSPFYIGPCKSSYGIEFKRFENMWQFSKVYEGDAIFNKKMSLKKEIPIPFSCSDTNGNPTKEWHDICLFGAQSDIAYRRPFTGKPLYHYYKNANGQIERLDYVESRKRVYIPEYAKLIYNTPTFQNLKCLADSGKKIALVDFDAYNYYNPIAMEKIYASALKKHKNLSYTLKDLFNIKTMKDVVNFAELPVGHGFVIKMLLQGDIQVIDGKTVDVAGVLV